MIPISIPHLYNDDKKLAIDAIKSGHIANGPNIQKFEHEFSTFCDRIYGVTCSNGTVALYMAIKSLKLPKRSKVILPSMTIISCLTAILENDLIPVFCDIDASTWNINLELASELVTDDTSALLIVNMYGLMIDTDMLDIFREKHPLVKIIEDASEAHGASFKTRKAGSVGDVSIFSFYANKIVTTGEGGIVLTNDKLIYDELMLLRNLNFIDRNRYIHNDAGFNFRLNNISCSIGFGQLQNISTTLKHRKRIASRYNKNLSKNSNIQIQYTDSNYNNVYWYYSILIKNNRDSVIRALHENNIDYRCFFYPLHKQPFVCCDLEYQVTEYVSEYGLILPTYTKLTNKQIDFISNIILEQL